MQILPSLAYRSLDFITRILAGLFFGWLELREAALAGERVRITEAGRQALAETRTTDALKTTDRTEYMEDWPWIKLSQSNH
jgi:hypothetical protein